MKTNINTIKDYINGLNFYGYFDDIDFSKFGKLEFKLKETIDTFEYRWCIIETNVYEASKDGEVIGHLAIDEVVTVKGSMYVEDCCVRVVAYNVREIVKKSYVIVNN